jgi:hypothetical protein
MDKITRWEWHGNTLILILLCITGILLPCGAVYFMTNILKIESEMKDSDALSTFLDARKKK